MFENVNTIIFDMDGTVLNTLEDLTVSVNYVLSKFDMPDHPKEEYRKFFGNGIKYALKCAVPEGTSEDNTFDTKDQFDIIYSTGTVQYLFEQNKKIFFDKIMDTIICRKMV